jgi:hypothetical protein
MIATGLVASIAWAASRGLQLGGLLAAITCGDNDERPSRQRQQRLGRRRAAVTGYVLHSR